MRHWLTVARYPFVGKGKGSDKAYASKVMGRGADIGNSVLRGDGMVWFFAFGHQFILLAYFCGVSLYPGDQPFQGESPYHVLELKARWSGTTGGESAYPKVPKCGGVFLILFESGV
jgi:hypothetical protein